MKTEYTKPVITPVGFELEAAFLTGSVTNVEVEIEEVKVEPFKDGFEEEGGFKELNFD